MYIVGDEANIRLDIYVLPHRASTSLWPCAFKSYHQGSLTSIYHDLKKERMI